jgi:hypothetical protein
MFKLARFLSTRPNMKLDPAVAKLLNLNPDNTHVTSAGGGGMSSASTSKITTQLDDCTNKTFFMKTGSGEEAEVMFQGKRNLSRMWAS